MDNRNIYGFVFFTLIVISTVFINYIFFQPAAVQVEPPKSYTRTECFTKAKRVAETSARPRVEQAVLDLDTKILDLNLNFGKYLNYEPKNGVAVGLHFYTKDPEPRKIATETVFFTPGVENAYYRSQTWDKKSRESSRFTDGSATVGMIKATCSYSWLSKLRPNQSLYVVTTIAPTMREAKLLSVEFNEAEAAPVLLYTEKR